MEIDLKMQPNSDILDPIQLLREFFCHQMQIKDKNPNEVIQKTITLED